MILKICGMAVIVLLGSITSALAGQAECERTVRALLYPYGKNKPKTVLNRFGTVTTIINGKAQKGFSLQTPAGSVYYDAKKNPTSLSFTTGQTYWSPNQGKTWKLVNPNSKKVMDAVYAGLRSQAEKAENITCRYGIKFEGRTVNHYTANYKIYNTGAKARVEYWVDPDNGFVWRDRAHTKGAAEVINDVRAKPAPAMTLPPRPR